MDRIHSCTLLAQSLSVRHLANSKRRVGFVNLQILIISDRVTALS